MELLGFIISMLLLLIVLLFRGKITSKHCKYAGLAILVSILLFVITLLIFKYLGVKPEKKIVISLLVSVWLYCLLIVFFYRFEVLVSRLINYQKSIGNYDKKFVKKLTKHRKTIINAYQFTLGIGAILSLYGLWIV